MERLQSECRSLREALLQSEERYRSLVDNVGFGINLIGQDYRIISANPGTGEILGIRLAEPAGKYCYEEFEKRSQRCPDCPGAVAMATGRHNYTEKDGRRDDGSRLSMRVHAFPLFHPDGAIRGFYEIVEDITKRKEQRDALSRSEAMLNGIYKAAPIGLCLIKDRVFQNVNRYWLDKMGYCESEIIGKTSRLVFDTEEEYLRVGRELFTDIQERGLASVQTTHRTKSGELADISLTAVPLLIDNIYSGMEIVAVEDITDRKRTIEALEANRKQLADIIDFLPDATMVIDRDEKIIAWNRAMEEMTGVRAEKMLGRGKSAYAAPFYGKEASGLINLALNPDPAEEKKYSTFQRKGDTLLGEVQIHNPVRGDFEISATASVLRDSRGEVVGAIECIRNNTERKQLEERLNRAEKMESLGIMAGGVAHDLNNILGIAMGYAELAFHKLDQGHPLKEYMGFIMEATERAAAIIQDMLTLARRGVITKKVLNLNTIIADCLRSPECMKTALRHPQVLVKTEMNGELLNIEGSPIHLTKAFMNLLSNAAETIRDSGTVTVRTENRYLDRPVSGYDQVQVGEYVLLSVADTGEGIPAEALKRIFEPFYTKKVMGRSGTGLGLSVVWGAVKDHQGYVNVESRVGAGTTFTLYFPVTRKDLIEENTVLDAQYMGKGEKILVVDDIREQQDLAALMLGRLNYDVRTTSSGEEALSYLREHHADLVVLDMVMDPGIDGLETYQRIIRLRPGQKAVIVSGYAETEKVKKAQELGAGDFVKKPYILEKIGLAVRRALDGK